MKAAICCPGPSLNLLDAPPAADILIGVNRAVLRFACHWLAAKDYTTLKQIYREGGPRGTPSLFTIPQTWKDSRDKFGPFPQFITTDQIAPPIPNWSVKTAPAALVLAAHLGATSIDVYGADWTNEPDFDGVLIDGTQRDEARWNDEAIYWAAVTAYLKDKGVTVWRHITADANQ